jgi:hypothetical protein
MERYFEHEGTGLKYEFFSAENWEKDRHPLLVWLAGEMGSEAENEKAVVF